jgi:hypothetical protein
VRRRLPPAELVENIQIQNFLAPDWIQQRVADQRQQLLIQPHAMQPVQPPQVPIP